MRLQDLSLRPATIACLHEAGICTIHELLDHSCRELIWHAALGPEEVYEIIRRLHGAGLMPPPTPQRTSRPPSERDLKLFRLRVVHGLSMKEAGQEVGVGVERVRQVLKVYFGLRGRPPAVKAQPRRSRNRGSSSGCAQAGRAIERLRTAKGLTIEQVAAHAKLSTEHLERIEDGLRDPTWTTLHRLAVALNTTAALLAYAIEVEKP
jgi:DNA-binding XRE family transcriptional regulator